jgi:hypothetical protein
MKNCAKCDSLRSKHVAARAGHVDERELLRFELAEQACEISRAQIRPWNADLGVLALAAPMADEHQYDLVALPGFRRELRQRALDVRLGRLPAEVGLPGDAVLSEPQYLGLRYAEPFDGSVGERL